MADTTSSPLLDTPTLGALRRLQGATGWCDEARVLYATTLATEALRRALIEHLDNIARFLVVGATPDQTMQRVVTLVADYYRAST